MTFVVIMVNIGKEIDKILRFKGISGSELARRINTTPQNVDSIKKRSTIDTELLAKISKALEFDFFKLYKVVEKEISFPFNVNEPLEKYGSNSNNDNEWLRRKLYEAEISKKKE